jgi:hypothetical protein
MTRRNTTARRGGPARRDRVIYTVAVVLLLLWLLGVFSAYTLGGLIHVLLFIAVVVLLIRLFQGKPLI